MAASAPGKLILFGEHAVVFGEPALSTAINLRAEVYARPHSEWRAGGGPPDAPPGPYAKGPGAQGKTSRPPWGAVRAVGPPGAGRAGPAAGGRGGPAAVAGGGGGPGPQTS